MHDTDGISRADTLTIMTTTKTANKCECGKRINQHARQCKACHVAKMMKLQADAAEHVARGTCPHCGTKLVRNLALTGWWQCGAYASADFRKPEFKGLPSCAFQTFTA
ncbi:MAG: hypothetical protein PVSMB8_00350 [Vulcanimicrobiaceae bacterium]